MVTVRAWSRIGVAGVVLILLGGAAEARPGRWPARVAATAAYAGFIAAAHHELNHERRIPTVAGAAGGVVAGIAVVGLLDTALHLSDDEPKAFVVRVLLLNSSLAGGVIGGVTAHALANSSRARTAVTAVGLAPVYAFTLAWTFD
jgi:hypothetical protein